MELEGRLEPVVVVVVDMEVAAQEHTAAVEAEHMLEYTHVWVDLVARLVDQVDWKLLGVQLAGPRIVEECGWELLAGSCWIAEEGLVARRSLWASASQVQDKLLSPALLRSSSMLLKIVNTRRPIWVECVVGSVIGQGFACIPSICVGWNFQHWFSKHDTASHSVRCIGRIPALQASHQGLETRDAPLKSNKIQYFDSNRWRICLQSFTLRWLKLATLHYETCHYISLGGFRSSLSGGRKVERFLEGLKLALQHTREVRITWLHGHDKFGFVKIWHYYVTRHSKVLTHTQHTWVGIGDKFVAYRLRMKRKRKSDLALRSSCRADYRVVGQWHTMWVEENLLKQEPAPHSRHTLSLWRRHMMNAGKKITVLDKPTEVHEVWPLLMCNKSQWKITWLANLVRIQCH